LLKNANVLEEIILEIRLKCACYECIYINNFLIYIRIHIYKSYCTINLLAVETLQDTQTKQQDPHQGMTVILFKKTL